MKIQYNGGRFTHVQSDIGSDLIARKLAVEVVPPPKTKHNTTFEICLGVTPQHPPYIRANCSCRGPQCGDGPTLNKTLLYYHSDRGPENIPDDVYARYERQYRIWLAGEEPRPSSVSAAQREIEAKRRGAVRRI
jgi:hypothetical protein